MQSKIEKKDNCTIYNIKFRSLTDLYDYLKSNPPVNTQVFKRQSSVKNDFEFSGEPLPQAIEYCIGGYKKDLDNFLKANSDLKESIKGGVSAGRRLVRNMYGGVPQAALVASGAPDCMLRYERDTKSKVRNIYFNLAYPAFTKTSQIINRGLATLYIVQALEESGEMVNFNAFELSRVDDEIVNIEVALKNPGDQFLNIGKCYYPIRAKEFLRRVLFRVLESSEVKDYYWGDGYGTALGINEMESFLKTGPNDLIISHPSEMGIRGDNIYDDTAALIENLSLQKEFDIPKIKMLSEKSKIR